MAHHESAQTKQQEFLNGLARGLVGALLFALPMLMTIEMWNLGLYADPNRLLLLCAINLPLLLGLAWRIGFEKTASLKQAIRDAVIAYGLGITVSAGVLWLLAILDARLMPSHNIAMVAFQSVPASIGALLGRSQLGMHSEEKDEERDDHDSETGYFNELFMMLVGALFLSLNVAPTEETILIAFKITPFHTLLIAALSIVMMHGFVYSVHFKGGHQLIEGAPRWHAFIRFTMPGYVIAIASSAYVLWTFERLDDTSLSQMVTAIVVLSLPGALGAASARLIL
ncbi:TIGR02587 family membrane protein [Brucella sp. BE17]|uniref:TIGR02587 family membrane protein n=1 Tax=Brucella sp. BE17 TaxID=3142977 RepID=UPI0031BA9371